MSSRNNRNIGFEEQEATLRMRKASSKCKFTSSRMKVFFSVEERDCLKIQDACNIMNNCFQTAMDAMKSLSELYLINKDLHKAQMVAAEMEQTKNNFYAEHEAVRRYENSRKASVSLEIISNNMPQRMRNKDLVKSTPQTAHTSGDNDISQRTSAEVRNSENDCPFDVFMKNRTKPKLIGHIKTNEFHAGQTNARTEGKRQEYLRSPSSNESLLVMVNEQDSVLPRSAGNAEVGQTPTPHVKSDYSHIIGQYNWKRTGSKKRSESRVRSQSMKRCESNKRSEWRKRSQSWKRYQSWKRLESRERSKSWKRSQSRKKSELWKRSHSR